ncbi:YpoC family protein [Lederbergia lenta]|uniref:YpoC n=1 Tax=Lederbergia lenta TaxID=1467 RepID=A0A2X4W1Q5_LEDLE|nr:hypothetical protein [Lederbergia lenta]MEC2324931.1 hypothetical protein [Lederbergia lenta]SQI56609.1 YpoC [Lederbergia lenta]
MKKYNELPDQLQHPLFNEAQLKLFSEEIGYYTRDKTKVYPWQQMDQNITGLLFQWEQLNGVLEKQFKVNKNGEKNMMLGAIAIFLQLLFWTNGEPVNLKQLEGKLTNFQIKPFNIYDRLIFIFSRPTSFHTFKQLQELMLEQQKKFAVKKA